MFYNVLHCFEGILSSLPKTSLSLCAVRTVIVPAAYNIFLISNLCVT